jgi:DNA-binding transcriptional MerR regulator
MFKIGEFSRLSNISVRSLHHYERIGLLLPEKVDDGTGYRYYAADQLKQARQIKTLREMGFSLPVIGVVIQVNDPKTLIAHFEARLLALEEERKSVDLQRERLRQIIEDIDSYFDVTCTEI